MAIGGICLRDNRTVGDKGSVSRVVQMTKECAEGLAGMDAEKSADYGPQSGRSTGSDWHELAERRLARLVDAEHDASVSRDRLELLQAESREFLVLSVTRLHRINELERELRVILASRSWRWTAGLRLLITRLSNAKVAVRRIVRKLVKLPLLRPVVRVAVRLLPGLSTRLHARLHATRR